jgi:hypothetical protein
MKFVLKPKKSETDNRNGLSEEKMPFVDVKMEFAVARESLISNFFERMEWMRKAKRNQRS